MNTQVPQAAPDDEIIRVFLADDDELDRLAVRRLIAAPNLELREFSSGEEVIAALERGSCDCLLLDYRMPGTDGLEVLDRISPERIPTIMLTGAGDEEVAVSSMRRGALDYLVKDKVDRELLLTKIRAVRLLHAARERERAVIAELEREISARESVLAVVSHDLRGPLNNIGLALSLLERGDAQQREVALTSVRRAVRRAERLIGDLLDVARLSGGRLALAREAVGVAEVLDIAHGDVLPAAQARGVELHVNIEDQARAKLDADRDRVVQVLDNLLRNAIKYGPPGGHVFVRARAGADMIEFSVADEGPGLSPDQREHVFERFWQAKDNRTPGGSGLGLAIAKGFVEAHGGTIGVEPAATRGARFWFTIPRMPS